MAVYLVQGRRLSHDDPCFADALAAAHAARHRPRCLCVSGGLEMYVARLGTEFLLKRMPYTGSEHAPECLSYEPPMEMSGLGHVLGSAITEDPATGITTLRLGFPMSKTGGRSIDASEQEGGDSVVADGTRLSLRALLHYLWDQAQLTHWRPGFAGRRTWSTVRNHLLRAADGAVAGGRSLRDRLYIPEVFSVDRRDEINARRLAQWSQAAPASSRHRSLMLLVGEAKELAPTRFGHKLVIKHVPDQPFAMDAALYRRMSRRFESELSNWGASDGLHLIVCATFEARPSGVPAIEAMTLAAVNANWLPVADAFELQLIDALVRDGRSFVKVLRYNMPLNRPLAAAVLTDAGRPVPLIIARHDAGELDIERELSLQPNCVNWTWHLESSEMPPLPTQVGNSSVRAFA